MSRGICIVLLMLGTIAEAQEIHSRKVRRFVLFGSRESDLPVALMRTQPVTLECDILSSQPPSLEARFYHCDRNWNVTQTSFVNDPLRDRTRVELPYEVAPVGIKGYSYTSVIRIPAEGVFDEFFFSGNYIVELWDRAESEKLASARFFVVEPLMKPRMRIANRQEPTHVNPYYQVQRISVSFNVPVDTARIEVFTPLLFSTVDVYKNREISRPRRIDADDRDPHTFVNGFGLEHLEFIVDDVQPGNEYRVLDLRNVDFYPQDGVQRARLGADVSRFLEKPGSDNNGGSNLVRGSRYADYIDFRFELLWNEGGRDKIHVVGDFDGWKPSEENIMSFEKDRYVWQTSLRRGRYDYQYVSGDDWILLEGNDWRTINNYTAFVYYRDQRFGGFDRILGVARGRSPGGVTATTQ
ncbi:MAG: DUF5103 domain-containing protein [Ignavibacteriales bacterium]|nr:DUF5103 domain-containing protein [Ignavibacteriales bacterium]